MNPMLFSTNVGSHMWRMNHEGSDIDVFQCYIADTKDILRGKMPSNHFTQENRVDTQRHEIGTVVNQLIKNNYNYIGYVFSPIVLSGDEFLNEFRKYARPVLSKLAYNSIHGLAVHNYKLIQKGKNSPKAYTQIIRALRLGTSLFSRNVLEFEPVDMSDGNEVVLKEELAKLEDAKQNGILSDVPSETDIANLYEFLIELRMKQYNEVK